MRSTQLQDDEGQRPDAEIVDQEVLLRVQETHGPQGIEVAGKAAGDEQFEGQ
jgi:hypothetical protein